MFGQDPTKELLGSGHSPNDAWLFGVGENGGVPRPRIGGHPFNPVQRIASSKDLEVTGPKRQGLNFGTSACILITIQDSLDGSKALIFSGPDLGTY